MADLDIPIALRRTRRSNIGTAVSEPGSADTVLPMAEPKPEPKTPRRKKKGVRFSDPGPSLSSGLTPFIRRTSILTPKHRRSSTPAKTSTHGSLPPPLPNSSVRPSPHAAFQHLRHTVDGRVERRLRRNNLRELVNKLELDKWRKSKMSQAEIERLKDELKARDREIYELQNATIVIDTERIWDLEQQVDDLKSELRKQAQQTPQQTTEHTRSYDWTLAARDPFSDDFMDMSPDDEQFGDATMAQFVAGTPSRGRSSFPTPPATSPPCMPSSPSTRAMLETPTSHVGVQAYFPDPAKKKAEEELASLQLEVCKLTTTLESYKSLSNRVAERLALLSPMSAEEASFSSTEVLEKQVEVLVQTMSDRTAALTHLTKSIGDLGFPGSDASEMIISLATGFRAARLELEYLTPGEVSLPLTSHGAQVLDLLLTRLRELASKAKDDETSIDEYHEIEQSLRKQLDARVSVMDGLKTEMGKAERLMNEKNITIKELQIGNDRLKGAVDGYIRDIIELEKLVERIEQESRDAVTTHNTKQASDRETIASKDANIAALESKIDEAVKQTASLLDEISKVEDSTTRHVVSMNKRHGQALALRDARVLELRSEIDRVNESLRSAHETIRVLRVEGSGLKGKMEDERQKAKAAMDSMKEELQRVLQMSQEFLSSPKRAHDDGDERNGDYGSSPIKEGVAVVREGGYLGGESARRASKKIRRRPDSGIGLVEEDELSF